MELFDLWMDECATARNLLVAEIRVNIRPMGKERPRENWRTPTRTREWEARVRSTASSIMAERPAINFPVAARLLLGVHYTRADIDNIEKIVWDALQPVVIEDDRFIRGYVEKGEKLVDRGDEFVWACFYARRAVDYSNYMRRLEETEEQEDLRF